MREVKPNTIWRHFKGSTARVITIAKHTETGEELVIYECTNKVDHEKYPDVKQKYRLELIDEGK